MLIINFDNLGEFNEEKEKAKILKWVAKELSQADNIRLPLKGDEASNVSLPFPFLFYFI